MILVWWYDPNNVRDMPLQFHVLYNSMIWPWHAIYNQQTWSYQCINVSTLINVSMYQPWSYQCPGQCINVSTLINVSMYQPWSHQCPDQCINVSTLVPARSCIQTYSAMFPICSTATTLKTNASHLLNCYNPKNQCFPFAQLLQP